MAGVSFVELKQVLANMWLGSALSSEDGGRGKVHGESWPMGKVTHSLDD